MFSLDQIVPWGRSFDEYRHMFRIDEADLQSTILGCGDGPAGFNADATSMGTRVVSCDPLYRFDAPAISRRIEETSPQVLAQTRSNIHEFVWDAIPSVDELAAVRQEAMDTFLADFPAGRKQGRYVEGELPQLPFEDASFDLAVCSHLLFLYSRQLDESFHAASVLELCRVASEVRIFPLVSLDGRHSRHVDYVLEILEANGFQAAIESVPYEFQRGANRMMRVRAA